MKNYLILISVIFWSFTGLAQTHFTSAHEGTNAESYTTIWVYSAKVGPVNLQAGDEIAIFDGSICVGVKTLTGEITTQTSVKAAKADAGTSNGYTAGHSISVKVWDSSDSKEYVATVAFRPASPVNKFADNESAYVDLTVIVPLTINLSAQNKEYDGTDAATLGYTVTGGTINGNVVVTTSNGKFNSKIVGTGKAVTGDITVTGSDATSYNFTLVKTTTANVTAKSLTVTSSAAQNKIYDGTNVAQITGATLSGVIGSDAVTLNNKTTGTFAQTSIGTGISVSTAMTISGTDAGNYTLTQPTGLTANITVRVTTIKPDTKSKNYGSTDPAFTYQATPAIVAGESLTGALSRASGESIGTYNFAIGTLSASSNYSLTLDPTNVFTIAKKALTLSGLSVVNKVYDGNANATLTGTASLSGIVGSESVTLSGTPSGTFVSTNVGNSITVNVSGYSLSGANSGNYTLNASITGNITPKALTVSGAVAENKVYDGTTAAVITGASLSGKVGSDVVEVTTPAVGAFAQKEVGTDISVSATAMTLSGASAGNYTLSYPTGLKASITKKDLTITPEDQSKCFGTTTTFVGSEFLITGLVSGDAVSSVSLSSTGAVATASAGLYDITASTAVGTGLGNYTLIYANGKLTVEELPVPTISGSAPVIQVPAQVVYTTETGMTNYVWTVTSGGTVSAGAGTNQVTVNWTSMTNQNITVTYKNASGCAGTYTKAITLTSLPTAVLSGSTSVCAGSNATLSVALTGVAPWRITYSDGTTSKTLTGINVSPYTFQVSPVANTTTTYTITSVMDASDMNNTGTGSAVVIGLPSYVAPTVATVNDLCYGANDAIIKATVPANQSASVKYLWQSSVDNLIWVDLANSNTLNYSPGEMYSAAYFRVSASIAECGTKVSNTIKVNVHEPITNAVVSCEKQILCFGDAPAVLSSTPSSGGNGSFNYQWQQKISGSWVNVGTNSLTYHPAAITTTTTFRIITRDKGVPSCGSVYSNELVITVKDPILAGKISADQKIVNGATPLPFTSVTAGSGSGTISYTWESSVDNGLTWTKISGAANATYASGALTQPTWFRRITISTENLVSCSAASDPVKISMWPTGIDNPENAKDNWSAYAVRNTEIRLKGEVSERAVATLYDIQGRVVLVKTLEAGSLNVIPTPTIKNGVYLLFVKDNELIQKFKVPVRE
jgi:hypothetical protein